MFVPLPEGVNRFILDTEKININKKTLATSTLLIKQCPTMRTDEIIWGLMTPATKYVIGLNFIHLPSVEKEFSPLQEIPGEILWAGLCRRANWMITIVSSGLNIYDSIRPI